MGSAIGRVALSLSSPSYKGIFMVLSQIGKVPFWNDFLINYLGGLMYILADLITFLGKANPDEYLLPSSLILLLVQP